MPIIISSITHTIHRNAGLERHSSDEAYISEAVSNESNDAISDHSTKSSTSGSGPLNGTKTPKGIPDHSTEPTKI